MYYSQRTNIHNQNRKSRKTRSSLFLYSIQIVFSMLLLAACNQPSTTGTSDPITNIGESGGDKTDAAVSLPQSDTLDLVLWTPSFFNPDPESSNSVNSVLNDAYTSFEAENPRSRIIVHTKSEQGGSTLYEYINSAHKVAPSILPDIIMLESQQLWAIADLGLIPPLSSDEFTGNELMASNDVYKFAQDAVTYKDNIYGIPYVANILHTVQIKTGVPDAETVAVPTTWSELFDLDITYFFPAGGRNGQGNDTLLLQYVGAGGELTNDRTLTQPDALVDVLDFMARGIAEQIIPSNVIDYSDVDSAWLSVSVVPEGFVEISSTRYLQERNSISASAFGATPTKSGEQVTIGRVWAFAVLSQEPERRALALKLVEHLVDPTILGPWGQSAHRLPVHRAALDRWGSGDPYYDFVRQQLEVTISLPNGTSFVGFSADIHQALLAVLSGEITAEEAVANIQSR